VCPVHFGLFGLGASMKSRHPRIKKGWRRPTLPSESHAANRLSLDSAAGVVASRARNLAQSLNTNTTNFSGIAGNRAPPPGRHAARCLLAISLLLLV